MRVDRHSTNLAFTHPNLLSTIQEQVPSLVSPLFKYKPSVMQLYDNYYLPSGRYPFMDTDYYYYPLSVLFRTQEPQMVWIRWKRDAQAEKQYFDEVDAWARAYNPTNSPYYDENRSKSMGLPFMSSAKPTIELCDSVPDAFAKAIEGKKLWYKKDKSVPESEIIYPEFGWKMPQVCQKFADVLAYQIGSELNNLSDIKLPKSWTIDIIVGDDTVNTDGINYRRVELSTGIAHVINIGVSWQEDFDVTDYVDYSDIHFSLSEYHPTKKVAAKEEILQFITNRGW